MSYWFLNGFQVQILAVELVLCWGTARRSRFWLRLLPLLAVYLALPEVVPGSYFALSLGSIPMGFLIMLLLSGGILALCFELDWKRIVFLCCTAHTVQHAVHALCQATAIQFELAWPVRNAFQLVVMVCALLLLVRTRRRGLLEDTEIENGQLLIFACFSSLLVYFLSVWTTSQEANTVGVNLFDLFCCGELLVILLDLFRLRKAQQERLLMLHVLRQERAQQELAKANIEVINRKCHDLKHQIAALRHMDDQGEKEKALGELEEAVLLYERFAHTGNNDLDTVLTEKGLLCEQQQISLQCIADGAKLSFMEPGDIYSLFGNALDNAIEGVRDLENTNRRIITLNIMPKNGGVAVHMENPCDADLHFEDGLPSTTKGDSDWHGFGMRSMRFVAEKYGGVLSACVEDGVFLLDILFLPRSAAAARKAG